MYEQANESRSTSPETPLTSSFYHANSTIDDLTHALVNFSRVPSPEPLNLLTCCCGREECEHIRSWLELKSRLESRLVLSAKVGQALLQRHEAYVRSHERSRFPSENEHHGDESSSPLLFAHDFSELAREKILLEKRLNQALVNNEVTEVSNKTILHELQEARSTISRLTAQHARSLGWETRLATLVREKDDMQQERDGESTKAKLAESRLVVMKDKTAKLQSEIKRLQDLLSERRMHRLESSEHILQDARVRLETLNSSQVGRTALVEQTELINVLESLVNDNETLKRDSAELQDMLNGSREEIHNLQQEVEELKIKPPSRSGAGTPYLRHRTTPGSIPSSVGKDNSIQYFNPRSASVEQKYRQPFEPLTPETGGRPLSPTDSLAPSEVKWTSFGQPQPRYPSSHVSIDVDDSSPNGDEPSSPEKPKVHRTLLLLTRSRAVQTDGWAGQISPSALPSYISSASPHDPRSESSSFSETLSSNLSVILERFTALHTRMIQADALTLTNRLKRQHLKGADVGHLSRSTVNNILSEVTGLRNQFRFLLEDENMVTSCTRKDFRVLFKLFRDIFVEMGDMRMILNDIILNPSVAPRVSELALDPNKVETERKEKEREAAGSSATSGWMAPISKLFSANGRGENTAERSGLTRSTSARGPTRPPPRFVPKLGPALSASATTVNVEFSGTAVGRSTTSTVASQTKGDTGKFPEVSPASKSTSSTVMNIFAGAPQSATPDPWVVVPKGPRRVQSFIKPTSTFSPATIRRFTNNSRGSGNRFSRDVDAIIDSGQPIPGDEEQDSLAPLLERTLRRRGLSDSSIHSTFLSQADESHPLSLNAITSDTTEPPYERDSVLQTLSRSVQNFRITTSGTVSRPDSVAIPLPQPSASVTVRRSQPDAPHASSSSLRNFLPNISSWAAGSMLDPIRGEEAFLVGSAIGDESYLPRIRKLGESHGHDDL